MDTRGPAIILGLILVGGAVVVGLGLSADDSSTPPSVCGNVSVDSDVTRGDVYNHTTVTLFTATGEEIASVAVRIADTRNKRQTGLSETEHLPDGEGMLFVHPTNERHTYWMQGMDFPLDIIFVTEAGDITTIHHAPTPDELDGFGSFSGQGKYVLEVPRGYVNATGIDVGDCLAVPDTVSA